MQSFAAVAYGIGLVLVAVGTAMLLPMGIELLHESGNWQPFLLAGALTAAIGLVLALAFRPHGGSKLTLQGSLLLMVLIWVAVPVFGSLPFQLADTALSVTDSVFESMSGFTTTGSTVLDGLDQRSTGILLWRGLLQWLGGIGVVVAALVFLPRLGVGGMQLFRGALMLGADSIILRIRTVFVRTSLIYVGLTLLCGFSYLLAGMTSFEAGIHAMTTIATGGFSTRDSSFGDFGAAAEYIAVVFMVLASFPFIRYIQLLDGRVRPLLGDDQIRGFLLIAGSVVAMLAAWQILAGSAGFEEAIRKTLFNGISILTGTGYVSTDYGRWGGFALSVFFLLGLIGGCAGSTTCSIKVFRFQVLAAALVAEIRRITSPHGVFVPRFQGQPISNEIISSVTGFLFLFVVSLVLLTTLLSATGLDLTTAASGAATALANVGPGLGPVIGPDGNFASLSDMAKWLLIAGMLLGRLEILGVLVLFQLSFWRD